jgi:hypothetical protein
MTTIEINDKKYTIDLADGQSLAIELSPTGPRAWYVGPMRIAPVLLPYVTGSEEASIFLKSRLILMAMERIQRQWVTLHGRRFPSVH